MRLMELLGLKRKFSLRHIASDLLEASFDAVVITDSEFNVIESNSEFEKVFGQCLSVRNLFKETRESTSIDEEQRFLSMWGECKEFGVVKDVALRAVDDLMRIGDLRILKRNDSWLVVFRNTLQFKERENRLKMVAQADKLTGLLNRQGLVDRLSAAISEQEEDSQYQVGVLFLDLDDFKPINDTYGHDVGDEILRHVAEAMSSTLPDYAAISRMGGDEFVCMIPVCESKGDLRTYGEDIISAVARDIVVAGGATINVKCSVGGALYPDDAKEYIQDSKDLVGAILKASDVAMYHAKKSGKNKVFIRDE